jgi:hypothetical protein
MPKRGHIYETMIALLLLLVGWVGVADAGRRSPESDLAAPGAALYENALTESLKSLMSKQEQAELGAEGRPPSPGPEYYWCDNCKTYHKRATPASAQQPAAVQRPGVTPAASPQPAAVAARPPSPGVDYYWCEKCQTYHKKQAVPNQPGAVTPAQHGTPAAAPGVDTRPPSPGPEFFWCDNCKTYHRRQPVAQQPGSLPATPHTHAAPPAGEAAKAQSEDYYYCENCKTYHRRQPVAQ